MLTVIKEKKDNLLTLRLKGSVDEMANLKEQLGEPRPEMDFYLKEVVRFNSIGVKFWTKFFEAAALIKSKVRFLECSPTVVEQLNMISKFLQGIEIVSVFVPFVCQKCGHEPLVFFQCDDLVKKNYEISPVQCEKCGGSAEFEDMPEEYFSFLMNRP